MNPVPPGNGVFAGAAFVGNQLLSVGADGNICIWGLSAPTSSTAVGSSLMSNRAEHEATAAAAAGRGMDRAGGQLQQQHLQRLQEDKESQGVSSLRSWLEPRRLAGGAAAVAGGVAVPQQQPMLVDEGKMHSSWNSSQTKDCVVPAARPHSNSTGQWCVQCTSSGQHNVVCVGVIVVCWVSAACRMHLDSLIHHSIITRPAASAPFPFPIP